MGSVLKASCPCGYSADELVVGGGRANFRTYCGAPALCQACHTIGVVNYLDEQPACPTCKGAVMFYDAPKLRSQGGPEKNR